MDHIDIFSTGTGSETATMKRIMQVDIPNSLYDSAKKVISIVEAGIKNLRLSDLVGDPRILDLPEYKDTKKALMVASRIMDLYSFWLAPKTPKADELYSTYTSLKKTLVNLSKSE